MISTIALVNVANINMKNIVGLNAWLVWYIITQYKLKDLIDYINILTYVI